MQAYVELFQKFTSIRGHEVVCMQRQWGNQPKLAMRTFTFSWDWERFVILRRNSCYSAISIVA